MGKYKAIADTYVRFGESERSVDPGEPLDIGFGRRIAYIEFRGNTGGERIEKAKLRLYAREVPFHGRIEIHQLGTVEIGAGISWNEAAKYEGEYVDTIDFYRGRTGWYEADVSRALKGVRGEFHLTFQLTAQTYPGREAIRLESGKTGRGEWSPQLVTEERGNVCGNVFDGNGCAENVAENVAENMVENIVENVAEKVAEEYAEKSAGIYPKDFTEDGYEMYLRYRPKTEAYCFENLRKLKNIFLDTSYDKAIRFELTEALSRMAGYTPEWCGPEADDSVISRTGLRIVETGKKEAGKESEKREEESQEAGSREEDSQEEGSQEEDSREEGSREEGSQKEGSREEEGSYRIREKNGVIEIDGVGTGVLYGVYTLISHIQREHTLKGICLDGTPYFKRRIFSHWDNFDGSIERGYAGQSFWKWKNPDESAFQRYRDYGRLCAAIGINGLVINNVNPDPKFISDENIALLAELADCFRDYGIRIYTSVSFDTPILQGGLDTADPEEAEVKAFWKKKADFIYRLIPDFGGFCVKGDSEGQPGPLKYGRDHACGANMLADVLKPYGGIVLWRAFVYHVPGLNADRACQAYEVFAPLDGKFRDNVILQIKNGPLDFQVNEPLSPLFGAMRHTKLGLEVQTALEYKGQTTHLCFVPEEFKRILIEETGNGKTAAVCREVFNAVVNTGNDRNWTRYTMAQANFFGTGRLAFDPFRSLAEIEEEWAELTFSTDRNVIETVSGLLSDSYATYAAYAAPYGLGFLCDRDTHFHPEPESRSAFHGCDESGMGYDRTAGGSGFCMQYEAERGQLIEDTERVEEEQLLWYHHLPFQYQMRDGRTLIQSVYDRLFAGAGRAAEMMERFGKLKGCIDEKRFEEIERTLNRQREESLIWRNRGLQYLHRLSRIPDERGRRLEPGTGRISLKESGEFLEVRTELKNGTLYLVDGGLATEDKYITEECLKLTVIGGYGVRIELKNGMDAYRCRKPEGAPVIKAFIMPEDGFMSRAEVDWCE